MLIFCLEVIENTNSFHQHCKCVLVYISKEEMIVSVKLIDIFLIDICGLARNTFETYVMFLPPFCSQPLEALNVSYFNLLAISFGFALMNGPDTGMF